MFYVGFYVGSVISVILNSFKPCPHCAIKLVSPVSGTGSMHPHYTQFHLTRSTQFHTLVPPETFRRVGFKRLRFIEHTLALLLMFTIRGLATNSSLPALSNLSLCDDIGGGGGGGGEKETEQRITSENKILVS